MRYLFRCVSCKCEEEKEIPIKEYDKEKTKQTCSNCGAKMERVIEWEGIAQGGGEGWHGARGGNVI